jgi:hypothetical protein
LAAFHRSIYDYPPARQRGLARYCPENLINGSSRLSRQQRPQTRARLRLQCRRKSCDEPAQEAAELLCRGAALLAPTDSNRFSFYMATHCQGDEPEYVKILPRKGTLPAPFALISNFLHAGEAKAFSVPCRSVWDGFKVFQGYGCGRAVENCVPLPPLLMAVGVIIRTAG